MTADEMSQMPDYTLEQLRDIAEKAWAFLAREGAPIDNPSSKYGVCFNALWDACHPAPTAKEVVVENVAGNQVRLTRNAVQHVITGDGGDLGGAITHVLVDGKQVWP